MLKRSACGVFSAVFLALSAAFFSPAGAEEKGVKILSTSDVHGNIFGDVASKRIGYAVLRGYADALEREGWTTYLVDVGDAFSGNATAQFDAGRSVAGVMGRTGYRVLNPGNHAFDYNQSERNEGYYTDVLLPAVRAAAAARVDAVTTNITFKGKTPHGMSAAPVLLHEEPGLRVLVAGVTDPYTASKTYRRGVDNYDFGLVRNADGSPDHAATKARVLDIVARAVAPHDAPEDVVVLLSHLGWDTSEDYAQGQISGRDAALTPNVDFVIDSHSHNVVPPERIGAAQYAIASRYMTHVAEITIPRGNPAAATLELKDYEQLSPYPPSETILAATRAVADRLGMGDRVFDLGGEVDLSDAGISERSTPLGRFLCREMRAMTGADFALFNAGGIRSGIAPGTVTVGDIYDVIPFQNNLQTFRLRGRDVLKIFEDMIATGAKGFPHLYGLTAYAYPRGDGENRYVPAGLLDADGVPVDPDGEYSMTTISFLAEGGDGYSFPTEGLIDDHGDFFSLFADHLRTSGVGDLGALNENTSLFLFPDREAAETAFDAAREDGDAEDAEALFADTAESFREHCVRVFIHAKSHEGDEPSTGTFDDDIRNERPGPVGGYWWDERHVVLHDPVLQDVFIDSIEIALPGCEETYPARVAGRFINIDATLLEVLPDASGNLPAAHPLNFTDGDPNEAGTFAYVWKNGEWRVTEKSSLGDSFLSDDGVETAELAAQGVLVGADGETIGLSFGDALTLTDASRPERETFLGADTPDAPFFSKKAEESSRERLRAQLASAVLETTLRLRIAVEDGEEEDAALDFADELLADGSAELRAPGIVVDAHTLLVPVPLPQEGIARFDAVTVATQDGRAVPARFIGAFRDYMAILIGTDEPLPAKDLPANFPLLNPLLPPLPAEEANALAQTLPAGELIQRWRIDYELGRRRETADYDRWTGEFRSYRDDRVVATRTSEQDASLAFDTEGNLAALALTPRLLKSERTASVSVSAGFRPVDFLARRLRAPDAFDPSLHPVDEGQGERLIDLGVEFQPLDANTSRLFHASRETRGGKIGLLVTHVYPGSIAAKIGLQEHDVLLRLFVEGRKEPLELSAADYAFGDGAFDIDMGQEEFQRLLRFMPPPWPPRDNAVSALLTGVGAGRRVTLDSMREGAPRSATFTTAFSEPDYRAAPREKFPLLGLTARPLTYEAARFFNTKKTGGVIVSKVEEGGKASVAGLRHYQLITHVDGREVEGLDDFAAKVKNFENGDAAAVELTVDSFGKTRLVKIE